jgi:predicted nucleic acid-binding protein
LIYLDSSVLLAQLFAEGRMAPASLWDADLISSQLLEYEVVNRIIARQAMETHSQSARRLLRKVQLFAMSPEVLSRALRPFSAPVRTLDALHLATMHFLRGEGSPVTLASFDKRLLGAAHASGFEAEAI